MNKSITKTCSNCGLLKPLSAFLQMSGPEGTQYGNLCAPCRKTLLEKQKTASSVDDGTTSNTSKTIDAKAKLELDTEKNKLHKEIENEYYDERKDEEKEQTDKTEQKQTIAWDERKRREKSAVSLWSSSQQHAAKAAAAKHNTEITAKRANEQTVSNKETKEKQDQALTEEQQLTTVDLKVAFTPGQSKLAKFGASFLSMETLLGKKIGSSAPFLQKAKEAAQKIEVKGNLADNDESEIIEKTFKPSSR